MHQRKVVLRWPPIPEISVLPAYHTCNVSGSFFAQKHQLDFNAPVHVHPLTYKLHEAPIMPGEWSHVPGVVTPGPLQ